MRIAAWAGFIAGVLGILALDLGLLHRCAHEVRTREALVWTAGWVGLALLFGLGLEYWRGPQESLQFYTGYLIELSLSMDNVFVMGLVFAYFGIPSALQHRVLFWGILGALLTRGLMIGLGAALIAMLHWVLYLLGAFVLFTGIRILFTQIKVQPERNRVIRFVRRFYPVTPALEGQRFLTRWQGKPALTPLALVLLAIETTDLVFAIDSVPAVFAVTTKPFIVFTSNVFAVLGLRSLYFVLAGAIGYFRCLKAGVSVVLVFIGAKMLLDPHELPPRGIQIEIPNSLSLAVVAGIILLSMLLSILAARRERRRQARA